MNAQRPLAAGSSVSATSAPAQSETTLAPPGPLPVLQHKKKKPGPKRDSKPAPSEKLERNRQAQRTHRERKEQYTKDLEVELLRLKELFTTTAHERDTALQARDTALAERDQLREENRRLQEYLHHSAPSSGTDSGYDTLSWACDISRAGSISNSDGFPSLTANAPLQETIVAQGALVGSSRSANVWEPSDPRGSASDAVHQQVGPVTGDDASRRASAAQISIKQELSAPGIDYDALGLDFVLSLERPCMGHIQFLHVRAHNHQTTEDGQTIRRPSDVPNDDENNHISGHALMATSTPYTHIMQAPTQQYPTELPQLQRPDLIRLLNLSAQLPGMSEPEVPPVRAWLRIMQDPRIQGLHADDFEVLKSSLLERVHCYRFGAVVHDYDIEDVLQQVVSIRQRAYIASPGTMESGVVKVETVDS